MSRRFEVARWLGVMFGVAAAAGSALAHEDGLHHSHPHLIVTNELLAAFVIAGAACIAALAFTIAKSRVRKTRHPENVSSDRARRRP